MHLRGSILGAGTLGAALLSLSGCAQQPVLPQVASAPNPFAYDKISSLCQVAPLQTAPNGALSVDMTVGSGEGACAVSVSKEGGGSYASFGVNAPPEHGKAFLYNYDGRTYIRYTPVTAYDGTDQFGVELISEHAQPRRELTVKVKVEAVGVTAPKAAPVAAAPSKAAVVPSKQKTSSTHAVRKATSRYRKARVHH
ncbi:hypothetical protein [Saccharibacter floricola]|uniref:Lipoprotein n=1 Tax=Saccharibacter floricola DSM 15669 TaxID=1123227 RepID=A0ABQ0NXS6_9PROT|nr:hypothetical protein [Saccharibacter floricola]GBQ06033.1 hypothetical protein AA15669_0752 [Saccharibacter floricola DSM 15669]